MNVFLMAASQQKSNSDWTISFSNVSGSGTQTTNTETIGGNITLFFEFGEFSTIDGTFRWVKNSSFITAYDSGGGGWLNQTLSFNSGDSIAIQIQLNGPFSIDGSIILKEDDTNGRIVAESFSYFVENDGPPPPCYLTTAMVDYYGYDDDGPELNALRQLRETKGEEYKEVLVNYQENSSIIIDKINFDANPEYWYNYIKEEVLKVVELVEVNNFDEAAIVYVNLYENLKVQFLTE